MRRRHEVKEIRKWMLHLCAEKRPQLFRYKRAAGFTGERMKGQQRVEVRVKGTSVREQLIRRSKPTLPTANSYEVKPLFRRQTMALSPERGQSDNLREQLAIV